MIQKISSDLYYTIDKSQATKKACELSILEKDVFAVIYSFSERVGAKTYFIERGTPFVRSDETLIKTFDNGKEL